MQPVEKPQASSSPYFHNSSIADPRFPEQGASGDPLLQAWIVADFYIIKLIDPAL